jgi:nucleotide-binding universal stress UspA family protein
MSFKTITACMTRAERYTVTLRAAASLAEAAGAHLSVLSLGLDRTNPGTYYVGAEAIVMQTNIEEARKEAMEASELASKILKDRPIAWDNQSITAQIGTLATAVGERTELSDVVVLPKPYGDECGTDDVVILESALFQTRVPVLVLPEGQDDWTQPQRVVVAWNQSPGALAAIRGAMSLLKAAESVDIVIVDPPRHAPDRSDPGGALAQMLSRHGVRPRISVLARTMPQISEIIARHCNEQDADLLVMGAYGHSRLRELILGGATRNTLERATLPVFMAH